MKKRFILYGAAALLMAGCSQTDDFGFSQEYAKQQISFTPYLMSTTRAITGDISNSTINGETIYLLGMSKASGAEGDYTQYVFADEAAQAITNLTHSEDVWSTDKLAFWQSNTDYVFYATNATLDIESKSIRGVKIVQPIDNGEVKKGEDIIVATATKNVGAAISAESVQLSFKHALSRFSVYAYTDKDAFSGEPLTMTSLKLYLPKGTADYTISNAGNEWGAWTGSTNIAAPAPMTAEVEMQVKAAYDEYVVLNEDQDLTACATPTAAVNGATQMGGNFFIVPSGNGQRDDDHVQLYMEISYKQLDQSWTKFVPVQDLHSFSQGYQTNLYICITNPDLMPLTFSDTQMAVGDWTPTASDEHQNIK